MAFIDDEKSQHDGEPIELYEFVLPGQTLRYTSGPQDFTFMSNLYTRATISRSRLKPSTNKDRAVLTVTASADLAIVQEMGFTIAPQTNSFTLTRVHPSTGNSQVLWSGNISDTKIKGDTAELTVPSLMATALDIATPTRFYYSLCTHQLYDDRCLILRTNFEFAGSVASIDSTGTIITMTNEAGSPSNDGNADGWYVGGEMRTDADGDRRLIIDESGDVLTINFPFRDLSVSDAVTIYAGCQKRAKEDCKEKFNNINRFGGHPHIPTVNIFRSFLGVKGQDD